MRNKTLTTMAAVLTAATILLTGCGAADSNPEVTPTAPAQNSEQTGNVINTSSENKSGSSIYVVTKADGTVEKTFNNEGELPVDILISYTLDGQTISPSELAGKSGHVTIRFDYVNNAKKTVEIDGVETEISVPFAMISGLLVKNSQFKNVEVTNGKLLDDGTRTVVVGVAFPGLTESLLGSSEESKTDIQLPEFVEVSADVTDFSLDLTMSIATSDVFADFNLDNFSTADELKEKLDKVNDAMSQLMDGSVALFDGLDTLYSKVGELSDGVDALFEGATALNNGAASLSNGAASLSNGANDLANGANSLSNGANELNKGAAALNNGAISLEAGIGSLTNGLATLNGNNTALNEASKKVFESLLATASKQLQASGIDVTLTIENYGQVLDGVAASLDADVVYQQALATVTAMVEANNDAITAGVTAQVREQVKVQVTAAVLASQNVSEETFEALPEEHPMKQALVAAIEANTDAQMETEQVQTAIATNVAAYKENLINENMTGDEVQAKLAAAAAGLTAVQNLKVSLDSYNSFYMGLQNYTDGVASAYVGAGQLHEGSVSLKDGAAALAQGTDSLAQGANALAQGAGALAKGAAELKDGAKALADGASALLEGVQKLKDVMPALKDGVAELKDGAGKLADGIAEFNSEAIVTINDFVNDTVGTLADRATALVDAAKEFGQDENGVSSAIKFIFRSEAID